MCCPIRLSRTRCRNQTRGVGSARTYELRTELKDLVLGQVGTLDAHAVLKAMKENHAAKEGTLPRTSDVLLERRLL